LSWLQSHGRGIRGDKGEEEGSGETHDMLDMREMKVLDGDENEISFLNCTGDVEEGEGYIYCWWSGWGFEVMACSQGTTRLTTHQIIFQVE